MIPLLIALAVIGIALLLSSLAKRQGGGQGKGADSGASPSKNATPPAQTPPQNPAPAPATPKAIDAAKMLAIENAGGLLARELQKVKMRLTPEMLDILYRAATQEDIHFNLATEKKKQVLLYPTATMDIAPVDDAAHLPQISPDQMMLDEDAFYSRFVMRELIRPEYFGVTTTGKRLYILLDISPSMFDNDARMPDGQLRDTWSRGVVASLLVDAIKGEAEYLFQKFHDQVRDRLSAVTPQEAEQLLSHIVETAEIGGGTNIGNAVRTAVAHIRACQEQETRMNHILLITDGEDFGGLTRDQLVKSLGDDIELHVVLIGKSWGPEHVLAPYIIAKF